MERFFEVKPNLWINADNVTHIRIDQLPPLYPEAYPTCALIRMLDGEYVTASNPIVVAAMLKVDVSALWPSIKEPF